MARIDRKIQVLTVDDHPLFRSGVCAMLNQESDIEVVGEAGNGHQAVEQYRARRPDIVIMDLRMPGLTGVEAIRLIRQEFPDAKILVFTTYKGDVEALRAINAGALGYMLKSSVFEELLQAVRSVSEGRRYFPAEVAIGLAQHVPDDTLSNREIAVLGSAALGNSNKLIACQLNITEETVKTHMKNILGKLNARDRTHAVTIGIQRGIIEIGNG